MSLASPFSLSIVAITALAFLGLPIGHAMICGSILYLALAGLDMGTAAEQFLNGMYVNYIILAVPLLNASANSGAGESFALALGSGAGFALALFLMSCAREHVELARVPRVFQGLPIAFLLAGLFALAFSGFAGMSFLE